MFYLCKTKGMDNKNRRHMKITWFWDAACRKTLRTFRHSRRETYKTGGLLGSLQIRIVIAIWLNIYLHTFVSYNVPTCPSSYNVFICARHNLWQERWDAELIGWWTAKRPSPVIRRLDSGGWDVITVRLTTVITVAHLVLCSSQVLIYQVHCGSTREWSTILKLRISLERYIQIRGLWVFSDRFHDFI